MVNPAPASASANASTSAQQQQQSSRRSFQFWCCNSNTSSNSNNGRVGGGRFQFRSDNLFDTVLDTVTWAVEKFVLILGPLLIGFASAIIGGLSWTFFTILLPMIQHKHAESPWSWMVAVGHIAIVVFFLTEIIFNYYMCVRTPNKGPNYDAVVRELAAATDFVFPETPQEVESFRRDYEARMSIRVQRRQQRSIQDIEKARILSQYQQQQQQQQQQQDTTTSTTETTNPKNGIVVDTLSISNGLSVADNDTSPSATSTNGGGGGGGGVKIRKTTAAHKQQQHKQQQEQKKKNQPLPSPQQVRNWMLMAHDEWGYCQRSKQPKPPRSHYDHVTKTLVLCLDHYCPWMFNAIGYFNYRYFCNFLWFVECGMMYGMILCYEPFQNTTGVLYKQQAQEFRRTGEWKHIYPMVPINSERLPISLAFMLCLAVGIAVAMLGGFHLYLCLSAQTTIEFHGNFMHRRTARRLNKKWTNPYSLGWRRNFQQVFGAQLPWWKAILIPSKREPEFLPLPLPGDLGQRAQYRKGTCHTDTETELLLLLSGGGSGGAGVNNPNAATSVKGAESV